MKTLIIGRQNHRVDITIDDDTISRLHAEISISEDGQMRLIDRNSTNGTFIKKKSEWVKISDHLIADHDEVRFGTYITSLKVLLKDHINYKKELPNNKKKIGKPKFNRETGEIIYE